MPTDDTDQQPSADPEPAPPAPADTAPSDPPAGDIIEPLSLADDPNYIKKSAEPDGTELRGSSD